MAAAGCSRNAGAPDLPHAPAALTPRFYAPPGWTTSTLRLSDGTALRYGVASPAVIPRGHVLILPDRNEPAEVWFETANDLLARGYTVWVLEAATGKGVGALDPSNGALARMVTDVIRPHGKALVLAAQGLGATLALSALDEGRAAGVSGAVLASPTLDLAGVDPAGPLGGVQPDQVATAAEWAARLRSGWIDLPGDGQPRLTHAPSVGLDPRRGGLAATWRRSDPTLRPHRTTLGWVWGYDRAIRRARAPSRPVGAGSPVVMAATASDDLAARACARLSVCTLWPVPTSAPHLARDEMRALWLARLIALLDRR
jgi:lysophospholipase